MEDEYTSSGWFGRDWKDNSKFRQDEGQTEFENYLNGIEKIMINGMSAGQFAGQPYSTEK